LKYTVKKNVKPLKYTGSFTEGTQDTALRLVTGATNYCKQLALLTDCTQLTSEGF